MPAISLIKLEESVQHIKSLYEEPEDLTEYMISFFETYADQTYHSGEKSLVDNRLPFYRIPSVIIKRLTLEFEKDAFSTPDKTMPLVDLFWQDRHYESRYLACVILGGIPLKDSSQVISKLNQFLLNGIEPFFLEPFLTKGSQRIRLESPVTWCDQASSWLQNDSVRWKSFGLLAYKILLSDNIYSDLPAIVQGLLPFFMDPHPLLISDGISLFQLLLSSFPDEMDFYISDLLSSPPNQNRDRLMRKALQHSSPSRYQKFRSSLS